MSQLSKKQVQAYINGWKIVKRMELEELRKMSVKEKLRDFLFLMSNRDLFKNLKTPLQHYQKSNWLVLKKKLSKIAPLSHAKR
jgi:hypothetical protein